MHICMNYFFVDGYFAVFIGNSSNIHRDVKLIFLINWSEKINDQDQLDCVDLLNQCFFQNQFDFDFDSIWIFVKYWFWFDWFFNQYIDFDFDFIDFLINTGFWFWFWFDFNFWETLILIINVDNQCNQF